MKRALTLSDLRPLDPDGAPDVRPIVSANRRTVPSATGSGIVLPIEGRHVATDGHNPLVVGSYPRQATGETVSVEIDGATVPIDVVRYVMANGRPQNWTETMPAWDAGYQSNVRRGRNKRGPTARVTIHGRWHVDVEGVSLTGSQVARMASLWTRTACEDCRTIVSACEACDGTGERLTGSTVKVCPVCRHGCGCMPESDHETVETQDVVDGGLATDLRAPRTNGAKRDAWLTETWERQTELSATCRVAVAHSELSDVLASAYNGGRKNGRTMGRTAHDRFDNGASSLRRSAVEHATARHASRFVIPRANRLAGAARKRSAGVSVLGSDAHGRQILGRRSSVRQIVRFGIDRRHALYPGEQFTGDMEGTARQIVGWGDSGRGYWIGHRFVPTARLLRIRSAARAAVRTIEQRAEKIAAESARDAACEASIRGLRGMAEGSAAIVRHGDAAVRVIRVAPGRWTVDDSQPLPIARAVARLTVRLANPVNLA